MEDIGQNEKGNEIEKQPMKPLPENNNPRQPPSSRPPKQCPRCDSFNKRLQPVSFCKSCSKYYGIGGGSHKGVKGHIKSSHASGGVASCSSSLTGKGLSSIQEQVPEAQPLQPPLPPPPSSQLPLLSYDSLGLPIVTSSLFKYLHRPPGFNQMPLQPSQTSGSSSTLSSILAAMENGNRALGLNQVQLNGGGIRDSNSANHTVLQGLSSGNPTTIRASQFRQQLINLSQQDAQLNMQMEDDGGNGKDDEKQPMNPPPKNNHPCSQPQSSQPPKQCPRCDSFNTKFCYFNNYSLSQPRYFCKSCTRYWTQGGTLKDVPFGGDYRKCARKSRHAYGTGASYSCSSTGKGLTSVHEVPPPPPPQLPLPPLSSGLLSTAARQDRDRPLLFNQLTLNGDGGGSSYANNLQEFSAGNPTTISASLQQLQQLINRSQDTEMKNMVRQPNRPLEGGRGSWTQMFINNNNDDDGPSSLNDFSACWDKITELGRLLDQPNNDIAGLDSAINNPNQLPDDDNDEDGVHRPAGYGPPPDHS